MKQFLFIRGESMEAAEKILSESRGRARPIAGGTDLLGGLKDAIYPSCPETLVDLKSVDGLTGVEEGVEGLHIGAMTRIRDVAGHPVIRSRYAALAQAAESVASPQIRNMGTLAGNICQEPRCWYYRHPDNTFHCARKGGDRCNAFTGDNRFHSVFGAMRVDLTPCMAACPIQTDIAAYLELLREDKIDEAATLLLNVNPMPAVTGRVCPHYCEQNCSRSQFDDSVSIRGIERFLGDHILANRGRFIQPPALDSGKSVAVVGAGPSGLSAAYFLRLSGHRVVVFDRMEEAGGMLRYGIPSFRLPKGIVEDTVSFLKGSGVEFVLGVEIGRDSPPSRLLEDYHALYMAGGAWSAVPIGLEGEEHAQTGIDFLASVNMGKHTEPGKRVLVIGGGNVAVDAAVTAKRLGAEHVFMACLEKREEMPALEWEIEHALQEGIELLTSLGPSRILLSGPGITGMELVGCSSVFDQEGRFAPVYDHSQQRTIECDTVILAVGQRPDDSLAEPGTGKEHGRTIVDPISNRTHVQGVYAGGDAVTGPATVVEAIAAGRRAALGINEYLGFVCGGGGKRARAGLLNRFHADCLGANERQEAERRPPSSRSLHKEDQKGLHPNQLLKEADRCFNCGCIAVCPSDLAPVLTALEAKIITGKRAIQAEGFFSAGPMGSTVLDDGELVSGVFIPYRDSRKTSYMKFRIRNSIDFPVASVAVALDMEGSTVHRARIVLGAAAPIPLRARRAEMVLEGVRPGEAEVVKASQAAVAGAMPLKNNAYKVSIFRALVKRAIMKALEST